MVSFDANMHGNRNIFVNIQYFLIATAYKTIYIFECLLYTESNMQYTWNFCSG